MKRNMRDDILIPVEQLKLFTMVKADGRKEYRYGPECVAQKLLREGGFPTPEEARAAWSREMEA